MKKILILALAFLVSRCSKEELGFKYVDFQGRFPEQTVITWPYDGTGSKVLEGNPRIEQVGPKDFSIQADSRIVDIVGVDSNGVYTRNNFVIERIAANNVILHWANNEPVIFYFNLQIFY